MIEIDFGDVDVREKLEGLYRGRITKVEGPVPSRSTAGQFTINVEFFLEDTGNRKIWETFSLQGNALWRLKEFLVGLGIEVPEGKFQFDPAAIQDMEVDVQVAQEPHWQDSTRMIEKVVKVTRAEGVNWG